MGQREKCIQCQLRKKILPTRPLDFSIMMKIAKNSAQARGVSTGDHWHCSIWA